MDYNIPNMYIQLKELAQTSAEIPEIEERVGDLEDQVDGLDEQINGDSTAEPPVPGIVDELEAIETTLYGDETADPPVEGLTDRVDDLELTINGDSTAQPPVPGLTDRVEDLENGVTLASVTADGVKTYSQCLSELYGAIPSGITLDRTILYIGAYMLPCSRVDTDQLRFGSVLNIGSGVRIISARLKESSSNYNQVDISSLAAVTYTSSDETVVAASIVLSLVKY